MSIFEKNMPSVQIDDHSVKNKIHSYLILNWFKSEFEIWSLGL